VAPGRSGLIPARVCRSWPSGRKIKAARQPPAPKKNRRRRAETALFDSAPKLHLASLKAMRRQILRLRANQLAAGPRRRPRKKLAFGLLAPQAGGAVMFVGPYPYHSSNTYLGMMAQEERMNLTSNNMANVNTPGYKKDVPIFEGYLVKQSKTYFGQGPFKLTENDLDMALDGPGFFQIETPNGVRFSRNGVFNVNSEGQIVTPDGYALVGAGVVPEGTLKVIIEPEGRVQAVNADLESLVIGQIELVEFEDPNMLIKEGYDFYVPKSAEFTPDPAAQTRIEQGYLEMSNVNPVNESVQLIEIYRIYEALQKIVHTKQEMDQKATGELGKLT
jgi:flagellar basal-body rod protein FlgG